MKILKNIIKFVITLVAWVIMVYPIFYAFNGVITKQFKLFNHNYSNGFDLYIFLIILFAFVTLILFIWNLMVGFIKFKYEQNSKNSKKHTKMVEKELELIYQKSNKFVNTNKIVIQSEKDAQEINKFLKSIREE